MEPNRSSLSRENSGIPSNNLSGLLEQLGTLNNRHEQLRALVEALEVRKQLSLLFFSSLRVSLFQHRIFSSSSFSDKNSTGMNSMD